MPEIKRQLTPQQLRFCEEYLFDGSPSKAALRSGYKPGNGRALMRNSRIKEKIEELQKARSDRMGITADRVLQELALIGFSRLQNIVTQDDKGNTDVNLAQLPPELAAPITEISVQHTKGGKEETRFTRVKLADKITALVNIGKHLGMFKDQLEVSGSVSLEKLVNDSLKKS